MNHIANPSKNNTEKSVSTIRRRCSICGPCAVRPIRKSERRCSLPPSKKSVQFSEISEVCIVEMSSDQKWYTGEDQLRFKRERASDLLSFSKLATKNSTSAIDSLCPVGLEQFLSAKKLLAVKSSRKSVIKVVLLEQMRQRAFGFQDPDQIALLSTMESSEALIVAQKRAKFQEMAKFV